MRDKVFCLGLPKTGTTSMASALLRLDYKVHHSPNVDIVQSASYGVDALTGGTVVPYMEALDLLWPDAKFILLIRDEKDWIDSCRRHYTQRFLVSGLSEIQKRNRREIWGIEDYDEKTFLRVSRDHILNVLHYFRDRSDKLLIINICAGEGYDKLCPFLELPIREGPFPHSNKHKD